MKREGKNGNENENISSLKTLPEGVDGFYAPLTDNPNPQLTVVTARLRATAS